MRDPELVARAQQAAVRLESAWDRWRALHGLAEVPVQPVTSYVGYSLNEPWGQPRVVIGVDAYEAEYLAAFLESHQCGQPGQVTSPLGSRPSRARPSRAKVLTRGSAHLSRFTWPGSQKPAILLATATQRAMGIRSAIRGRRYTRHRCLPSPSQAHRRRPGRIPLMR